jgi:hypothetical protein
MHKKCILLLSHYLTISQLVATDFVHQQRPRSDGTSVYSDHSLHYCIQLLNILKFSLKMINGFSSDQNIDRSISDIWCGNTCS